jgi:Tol biopolymer transport system component
LLFGSGDIYIRDSIDGPALVIGGRLRRCRRVHSRRRGLIFLRRVAGTEGSPDERLQLFTANTDGSNVVALTPPLVSPDWADFAPDNGSMVFMSGDPATGQWLFVANLLQPGEPRQLPLGNPQMSASFPNYLGPTGDEIVFRGRTPGADGRSGIFAIRPDGKNLRPITRTDGNPDDGYQFPQPSPDGRYIAYTWWDPVLTGSRINILDLRTGEDRILTDVGRSEGYATFSPDSRRIVFVNYISDTNQIMVEPVDGSSRPVPMGPSYRQVNNTSLGGMFSPDGKWVVVTDPGSGETRLVDAAKGGKGTLLAWSAADVSGWQRLAP